MYNIALSETELLNSLILLLAHHCDLHIDNIELTETGCTINNKYIMTLTETIIYV